METLLIDCIEIPLMTPAMVDMLASLTNRIVIKMMSDQNCSRMSGWFVNMLQTILGIERRITAKKDIIKKWNENPTTATFFAWFGFSSPNSLPINDVRAVESPPVVSYPILRIFTTTEIVAS